MTRITPTLLALAASLLISSAASAGPIVVFDSLQEVGANAVSRSWFGSGSWSDSITQTIDEGRTRATASQASDIFAHFMGGQGLAEVTLMHPDGDDTFATSRLRATFNVDEPTSVGLDVEFFQTIGGDNRASLFNNTTSTMVWEVFGTDDMTTRLVRQGLLEPGIYTFFMQSFTTLSPDGRGVASFDGGLTVVPEPATMTLFGVGLAATAWRRRRQMMRDDIGR